MSRTRDILSAAATSTYFNSSNTNSFVISNNSGSASISGGNAANTNSVLLAGSGNRNPVIGSFGGTNTGIALHLQTQVAGFPLIQDTFIQCTTITTDNNSKVMVSMPCTTQTGVYFFDIDVRALCTSGAYVGGGFDSEIRLAVKNTSGTLSYLTEYDSINPYEINHYKSNPSWVSDISLSSSNVRLEVAGDIDETLVWQAFIKRSSITPI